jgi:hypothetical protein
MSRSWNRTEKEKKQDKKRGLDPEQQEHQKTRYLFSSLALKLKVVHKVLMSSNWGHVVFVQ